MGHALSDLHRSVSFIPPMLSSRLTGEVRLADARAQVHSTLAERSPLLPLAPGGRGQPADTGDAGAPGGPAAVTFVLRLSRDETGRITGIVERVRTGERERVEALDGLAQVIGRMVANEAPNHDSKEDRP